MCVALYAPTLVSGQVEGEPVPIIGGETENADKKLVIQNTGKNCKDNDECEDYGILRKKCATYSILV